MRALRASRQRRLAIVARTCFFPRIRGGREPLNSGMNAARVCLTMYCIAALVAAHALQAAENPPVMGEAEQVTVTAQAESLTSQ